MGDIPGLCGPIRPEGMNKRSVSSDILRSKTQRNRSACRPIGQQYLLSVVSGWPRGSGSAFGFNSVTLYCSFAYSALACSGTMIFQRFGLSPE